MTAALVDRPTTAVARTPVVVARRPLIGWAVRDAATLTWRNLVGSLREPQVLIFAVVQPVMFVLLFRYVFGGAIAVPGGSYVNFLMPGIFTQIALFAGTSTGIGLAEDLKRGVVDRFRTLPMATSAVLTGRTLADALRLALSLVIMTVVGLLVGYRPEGGALGLLGALGVVLLLGFAFIWAYALVGLVVRSAEATQGAGFVVVFPLTFASSAFVPTESMPGWLRVFAENQPVTLAANAARALTGVGDASVWPALAWSLGLLVVLLPLAVAVFRRIR